MYLGQLAKLRDALRTSKINVILDSRDEEELRNQEKDADGSSDDQVEVSEIRLSDQVSDLSESHQCSICNLGTSADRRQLPRQVSKRIMIYSSYLV